MVYIQYVMHLFADLDAGELTAQGIRCARARMGGMSVARGAEVSCRTWLPKTAYDLKDPTIVWYGI